MWFKDVIMLNWDFIWKQTIGIFVQEMYIREDHFEMNFMVKTYKFAKSLVKIGTSNAPRPFLGPTPL